MADNVSVDTGKLRTAAHDLNSVAHRISGVLTRLEATAALHEGKWGSDDTGRQFADGQDGQPGYVSSAQQLEQAVGGTATVLGRYAQGLTDAANLLDHNETTSSETFTSLA